MYTLLEVELRHKTQGSIGPISRELVTLSEEVEAPPMEWGLNSDGPQDGFS